jgi:REP element-mobilizing transposase RayT
MPRQSRIDYPGALHHVMVRGVARGRIVDDDTDRKRLIAELAEVLPRGEMACLAWVVMSNHVHLLVRTGSMPLGRVMQRWLTRYAGAYNHRHHRSGHFFQNRYKAILVEEEPYLLELVRYIHLNPLRAQVVSSLAALGRYPWSGHAALVGKVKVPWQSTDEVLELFAKSVHKARPAYHAFLADGVSQGHRDDLSGGGVLRALRALGTGGELPRGVRMEPADPRILGGGTFVEKAMHMVEAADRRRDRLRRRLTPSDVIKAAAKVAGIPEGEIRHSNRRRRAVVGRALACKWLVEDLGMKGVEVAKLLGITGAAVTQGVERGRLLEEMLKVDLDAAT